MKTPLHFSGFEDPFYPKIYEGEGEPSLRFNAVRILLDASDRSLLRWDQKIALARKRTEQGFKIFWELDFAMIPQNFEEEASFLALQLNIGHFHERVWRLFEGDSIGVALYRGVPQKNILEALKGLVPFFAEEAQCFVYLDTQESSLEEYFSIVNLETLGPLFPILKGEYAERYPWAVPALAWGHGVSSLGFSSDVLETLLEPQEVALGICLPENPHWGDVEHVIQNLGQKPFKMLPEALLTQEWEGVDTLIVFQQQLTDRALRKLKGFTITGGEIISYPDGVPILPLLENAPPSSPASSLQTGR